MNKSDIRIGIIGAGHITQTRHLPALKTINACRVTALCDIDSQPLASVADQFKIAQRYMDYHALIDSTDVDVIAICTPPRWHGEMARAALRASKPVFIEKPLALSLDECERLLEESQRAGVPVTVGFNLRHHRLLRRAREWIRAGRVGTLTGAVMSWTRSHGSLPDWHASPNEGGDLLWDMGVHHFDLWRFLFDSEVVELNSTRAENAEGERSVVVSARLLSGVTVTSFLAEGTMAQNEIQIFGTQGQLRIDGYRFDGFEWLDKNTYTGNLAHRVRGGMRSLGAFPRGLALMRQGGDYVNSYRAEWAQFLHTLQSGGEVDCTVEDGISVTQIALAALRSAESRRTVTLDASYPVQKPGVLPSRSVAETPGFFVSQSETSSCSLPALSAIVVIPDAYDTVRQTMSFLRAQTRAAVMEIVFVLPRGVEVDARELNVFHSWQCVPVERVVSIGRAYAAGVRCARAPLVALTEDHSFPAPNWAQVLIEAHRQPHAAVGPALTNGNPNSLLSWADFYIAYGEWALPIPSRPIEYLPGHNSSYKREVLLTYGEQLEAMLDAETVLHWDLRVRGHTLYLEAATSTAHLNFAQWRAWFPIKFYAGQQFGARRSHGWSFARRLIFFGGSPLIPFVRLVRVVGYARRTRHSLGFWLRFVPVTLIGLIADGMGQMLGYGFGAGNSFEKGGAFEFHRVRYLQSKETRFFRKNLVS
jgi:predicted dehydrogenase